MTPIFVPFAAVPLAAEDTKSRLKLEFRLCVRYHFVETFAEQVTTVEIRAVLWWSSWCRSQMSLTVRPEFKQLNFTVRFERGYRYLDRCGEAIVRLEDTLDKDWIPGEVTPTGGNLRQVAYGMTVHFNSDLLAVEQSEFIGFDVFKDQSCKLFEILLRTFEIKKIRVPAFRATIHVGFDNEEDIEAYITRLGFVNVSANTTQFLGGDLAALSYVVITEGKTNFAKVEGKYRHRLAVNGIRQAKQLDFDSRMMQRLPLLLEKSRDAIKGMLELRRKHVSKVVHAAQFEFEQTLEPIYETIDFSLGSFLESTWSKANEFLKTLPTTTG